MHREFNYLRVITACKVTILWWDKQVYIICGSIRSRGRGMNQVKSMLVASLCLLLSIRYDVT